MSKLTTDLARSKPVGFWLKDNGRTLVVTDSSEATLEQLDINQAIKKIEVYAGGGANYIALHILRIVDERQLELKIFQAYSAGVWLACSKHADISDLKVASTHAASVGEKTPGSQLHATGDVLAMFEDNIHLLHAERFKAIKKLIHKQLLSKPIEFWKDKDMLPTSFWFDCLPALASK